ncbi:hypothetical protein [Amycolatopsis coloradensis]|uniref:hypothetical protein n=1 Tax=Amycolatopsis coloradensis TaxID=76021 RepID=UPI001FC9C90A|nr:hypothetical protein [Amycolatopsis coloradensis]
MRGLSVTASSLLLRPGSTGVADADEEQRLVLDTVAADVVSVGKAAQTLKSA